MASCSTTPYQVNTLIVTRIATTHGVHSPGSADVPASSSEAFLGRKLYNQRLEAFVLQAVKVLVVGQASRIPEVLEYYTTVALCHMRKALP